MILLLLDPNKQKIQTLLIILSFRSGIKIQIMPFWMLDSHVSVQTVLNSYLEVKRINDVQLNNTNNNYNDSISIRSNFILQYFPPTSTSLRPASWSSTFRQSPSAIRTASKEKSRPSQTAAPSWPAAPTFSTEKRRRRRRPFRLPLLSTIRRWKKRSVFVYFCII